MALKVPRKVLSSGISLFRAFMGHILMDRMLTFWLDAHIAVFGRALHRYSGAFPMTLLLLLEHLLLKPTLDHQRKVIPWEDILLVPLIVMVAGNGVHHKSQP